MSFLPLSLPVRFGGLPAVVGPAGLSPATSACADRSADLEKILRHIRARNAQFDAQQEQQP